MMRVEMPPRTTCLLCPGSSNIRASFPMHVHDSEIFVVGQATPVQDGGHFREDAAKGEDVGGPAPSGVAHHLRGAVHFCVAADEVALG